MKEVLTIKIPYNLARLITSRRKLVNKYETNQLIKAFDTWFVLKAEAPGSYIQNWNSQKKYLFKLCKCSETIFRHRIKILSDLNVLKFSRDYIRLVSWQELQNNFQIDIKEKLTLQYKINSNEKVCYWITAAEIKDNQNRQGLSVLKKVNNNPELKMQLIAAMLNDGADPLYLKEDEYFLKRLKILYLQDFVRASEIHDVLIKIRPDCNRSTSGIAKAWRAKHGMTASYWKRKLKNAGIADISQLQVRSETRTRNKDCKVLWLNKPKETLLCLCDQIVIMEPWLIQNLLAA